jgi:hypothetical protein
VKEQFIDWKPGADAVQLVEIANTICAEYAAQGFDLTLRQLYYQFVARGHIPNTMRSYKRLGSIVDQARLAGLLDWRYIVDRTRNVYRTDGADTTPEDAIESVALSYSLPLWDSQPNHVEVWVEKEALTGIVQQAAQGVQTHYFACRGYVSQSEMYSAGIRFRNHGRNGKTNHVIHLGDHDPSGIDMTRDIEDRLTTFAGRHAPTVHRIALNMDQVEQYNPPPNPAKVTDSRYEGYERVHGDESWELDALNPTILNDLITTAVMDLRDEDLWRVAARRERLERAQLQLVSDQWSDVVDLVGEPELDDEDEAEETDDDDE